MEAGRGPGRSEEIRRREEEGSVISGTATKGSVTRCILTAPTQSRDCKGEVPEFFTTVRFRVLPSKFTKMSVPLALAMVLAWAQEKPQKQWVNEGEQNLVTSLAKETTPAGRLAKLDEWSKSYPQTAFAAERQQEYLIVYEQL